MTAVMRRPTATTVALPTTSVEVVDQGPRPRWPWWAAFAAFIQYTVIGFWLFNVQHYFLLDNASRSITARILIGSRDPHLGAMGFYWPPLPMLIRVPLVLVLAPLHQGPMTGAVSTAILSALVLPVLAAIARELQLTTGQGALLVGLYALNPVVVYYAANGLSEASFSLCLAISFLGYIRFCKSKNVKDMRLISIGLALGMMCRVEFIPITIGFVVACALQLPRDRWRRAALLIALPPLYVFALWTWASSILAGDALYWYHAGKASGSTPDVHPWLPQQLTPVHIIGFVLTTSLVYAPVLLVLVLLIGAGGVNRLRWLGMVLVAFALPAFIALELMMRASNGAQRYFSTMALVGCVLAMWVISTSGDVRRGGTTIRALAFVAMAVGVVAVIPLNNDKDNASLMSQQAFFGPLMGQSPPPQSDQVSSLGPLIEKLDPELEKGAFVAMDSRGGLAILLTRFPRQFIVPEDREFEEIMSDPEGRFTYVIRPTVDLGSKYGDAIDNAMHIVQNGRFEMVDKVAAAELWKYVPNATP
jgi:Dolichyl-phosphate-mannose-protein mannosyltransferase